MGLGAGQLDVDDLHAAEDLGARPVGADDVDRVGHQRRAGPRLQPAGDVATLVGPREQDDRRSVLLDQARDRERLRPAGEAREHLVVGGEDRGGPVRAELRGGVGGAGSERDRRDLGAQRARDGQELRRGLVDVAARPSRRRPRPPPPQITFASASSSTMRPTAASPWTISPPPFAACVDDLDHRLRAAQVLGREAEVGGREPLERLLLRLHDPLQARIARLGGAGGDGHERGGRAREDVVAPLGLPFDAQGVSVELQRAHRRDAGVAEQRRDGHRHRPRVAVRRLDARDRPGRPAAAARSRPRARGR